MFGRMMNNYYYGKSGKGDFRKEDLPTTRSQLFKVTLKTRLGSLCRLNLLYALFWLPTMLLVFFIAVHSIEGSSYRMDISDSRDYKEYIDSKQGSEASDNITKEQYDSDKALFEFLDMDYEEYAEKLAAEGVTDIPNEKEFAEIKNYSNICKCYILICSWQIEE